MKADGRVATAVTSSAIQHRGATIDHFGISFGDYDTFGLLEANRRTEALRLGPYEPTSSRL